MTRLIVVLTFVTLMSGCGFKLRQAPLLDPNISGVAVSSSALQSRLARAVEDKLSIYQIPLIKFDLESKDLTQGVINVELQPENLERRLLSLFPTGQVAEYELIYSVSYTVTFPEKSPQPGYIEILREYQDDPTQVLAKARELELIISEMRAEAADKIIRLLPSQSGTQ